MSMAKIRKDDTVQVMVGKDKGRQGKVIQVLPAVGKVIVEGINIAKKHKRARNQRDEKGIIEKNMPLSISKVMLVDPKVNLPTRVGFKHTGEGQGKKVRISKKTGEEIA